METSNSKFDNTNRPLPAQKMPPTSSGIDIETDSPSAASNWSIVMTWGRLLLLGIVSFLGAVSAIIFVQLQGVSVRVSPDQSGKLTKINTEPNAEISADEGSEQEIKEDEDVQLYFTYFRIVGVITLLTCSFTSIIMAAQLRDVNQPLIQRKILAMLCTSPIYGMALLMNTVLPASVAWYTLMFKTFYETLVLYQLASVAIAVVGRGSYKTVVNMLAVTYITASYFEVV